MENHTKNAAPAPAGMQAATALNVLDDFGEYIHKINALLRAACNTGAGEEEDQAWLVDAAWDAAIELKKRYMAWSLGPVEEAE